MPIDTQRYDGIIPSGLTPQKTLKKYYLYGPSNKGGEKGLVPCSWLQFHIEESRAIPSSLRKNDWPHVQNRRA